MIIAPDAVEEVLKHSRVKMQVKPVRYNPYVFKHTEKGLHNFLVTLQRGEEVMKAYCSLSTDEPTLADVVTHFVQIAVNVIPAGYKKFCKAYGLAEGEWNSQWCYKCASDWTTKLHKILGDDRFDRAVIRPGERAEAKREKKNAKRRVELNLF